MAQQSRAHPLCRGTSCFLLYPQKQRKISWLSGSYTKILINATTEAFFQEGILGPCKPTHSKGTWTLKAICLQVPVFDLPAQASPSPSSAASASRGSLWDAKPWVRGKVNLGSANHSPSLQRFPGAYVHFQVWEALTWLLPCYFHTLAVFCGFAVCPLAFCKVMQLRGLKHQLCVPFPRVCSAFQVSWVLHVWR